jgi:hypothetical protein
MNLQEKYDVKLGKLSGMLDSVLRDVARLHAYELAEAWCKSNSVVVHFGKCVTIYEDRDGLDLLGAGENLLEAVANAEPWKSNANES